MKKIFKLLLLAALLFFLQLISTKNYVHAQYFYCNWNTYVNACIPPPTADPCPAAGCQARNCDQFTPLGQGGCNGSHACYCPPTAAPIPTSEQLNLPALYGAIQSAGGTPLNFLSSPGGIISYILNYIIPIAGLILLIFLIIGGFKFMTSAGDPKAAQSAKGTITTALVGFIIIFLAYWITKIAGIVLGIGQIGLIF